MKNGQKIKKKHRNANKNHMKEISDESIMMKCSLRKFDMAWFKVNRNRCQNMGKIYVKNIKGLKEGYKWK